ncbi:putative polygalacturonase-like [Capsicum annuum]|nr:putative polygalacturonase-like [Capsicum annuum]
MVELLSTKMIKSFTAIQEEEHSNFISSIRSMRGSTTNITQKIFWCTNSVTCRSVKICRDRDEVITIVKEVLLLIRVFDVTDLFPSWKLLHKINGTKSRFVSAHKKVDAAIENILNEHIANKAFGNKGNGEFGDEDLIDVFLMKRVKENAELQFPIENDHIKAVILETLRLHPPAPLIGPRECRDQTVINGYAIPLKTRIIVNAWALDRDLESWNDPESFIPERFENSSIDFIGNYFEFIPFGAGRSMCPRVLFVLDNVTSPIAQLLLNYKWELPNGTNLKDLDKTEIDGITTTKKEDLLLVTTDHRNDQEF